MTATEQEFPTERDAYELIDCVGQGASSKVWKAYCKPMDKVVAVKILDLETVALSVDEIRVRFHVFDLSNIA